MIWALPFIVLLSIIRPSNSHYSTIQDFLVAAFESSIKTDQNLRDIVTNVNEISRLFSKFSDLKQHHPANFWTSQLHKPQNSWIPKFQLRSNYDFIIVGSGPAGSVIANRLSEIPEWNILLIEIGNHETPIMNVPILAPSLQFSDYNWEYYAEFQPNVSQGLMNERMHWPRGRALGGTSTINYMIYTRGNPVDYNNWAAQGNPGWSYREVLPYFIKSERARISESDPKYHNENGNLANENVYKSRLLDAFIEGGAELGLPHVDYNSPETPFGVGRIQATVKNGRRHTAANAFLKDASSRPNLHILRPAYATKVLINQESRQAEGVQVEYNGKLFKIMATKEVILSAGAFNSPQLLMLSGIGPEAHLRDLGIPLFQNLPVGQNLHDHLTFPGMAFVINSTESLGPHNIVSSKSLNDFVARGTGPLTSLGGVEGIGYIKTEYSTEIGPQPDIELLFIGGTLASDFGIATRRGMKLKNEVYDSLFRPLHGRGAWTVFPMLLHPKSVGWMELSSKNPRDYPKFYGNFFTDPENRDIKTFIASIRFTQKLAQTRGFQRFGSYLSRNSHPGCEHHIFDSDDYWECCIRSIAVTLHHQVGTCRMGPKSDPRSVVNHELKVHGVERLRVADCSIIPFALSAHTNVPSFMVGEKAADMIKAEWLTNDFNVTDNQLRKRSFRNVKS